MTMISSVVGLLFLFSLTCAYPNVLVLVVEESSYLSSLSHTGVSTRLNHGSLEESLVASLEKAKVHWKVYVDGSDCAMDPVIFSNFSFLISPSDVSSIVCPNVSSVDKLDHDLSRNNAPTFGIYFAREAKANNPDWLRRFMHQRLSNPEFMDNTLIAILTAGKNDDSSAPMLLLGKGSAMVGKQESGQQMIDTMKQYGWNITRSLIGINSTWFDRVFIVILENQPLKASLKNPFMRTLTAQGTLLTEFNAIVNPSQPNYIALTAGDLLGVHNDLDYDLSDRFIVDLFEENHVSWKAYMQDYPGFCFTGTQATHKLYKRKHNPFISFRQVSENDTLCDKIVEAGQLREDVMQNALPRYSFYTPNMNNNGHDTGLDYAAEWLHTFLSPLLKQPNFMDNTLVVVTFDEGIKPDNKIYTLFLGDMVPFRNLDSTNYTHYSLLRLIEEQLSLGSLKRADATAMQIDPVHFYPGDIAGLPSSSSVALRGILIISMLLFAVSAGAVAGVLVVRRREKKEEAPSVRLEESALMRVGEEEEEGAQ